MAGPGAGAGGTGDVPAESLQRAAATFGLLASTMRLHIVCVLARGERDVGALAEEVGGTPQTVSQHLAKLKLAGLVRARREGRYQVYLLDDRHLAGVVTEMVERAGRPEAGTGHARGPGTGRVRGVGA